MYLHIFNLVESVGSRNLDNKNFYKLGKWCE